MDYLASKSWNFPLILEEGDTLQFWYGGSWYTPPFEYSPLNLIDVAEAQEAVLVGMLVRESSLRRSKNMKASTHRD